MSDLADNVEQKLEGLPVTPGCYLFRDQQGGVLYVGKAKSLRSRVRSYFQPGTSDTRAFIEFLPRLVFDLETFVTTTEKEAAILENSLIKEHRPRLNVKLRDDKEFLTLRLDARVPWPRLDLVRRPDSDGARYFGPYHSATAARRTLHVVERYFQLRTCSDRELANRKRPCIQYQMKRCPAPCCLAVDREEYQRQVETVGLFLVGRQDELGRVLGERMRTAASDLNFEVAAHYRDRIDALAKLREKQRVVAVTDIDQDVLGLYREGDLIELSVVCVRQGRVVEILNVSHARTSLPVDEIVAAFLREHYGVSGLGSALIPDEIIVPALPEGSEGVREWLDERRESLAEQRGEKRRPGRVALTAPQRGPKAELLDLALENAAHAFREKRRRTEDLEQRLLEVQRKLRLPVVPRRIECCDISHLGGESTVGSVVSLEDGQPDKKRYKSYRVRGVSDGDDYAAMYEVLSRRFARGQAAASREEASREGTPPEGAPRAEPGGHDTWALPDLFVVDGGRGQLGVALAAAADLGLSSLPIVGLAKERETVTGDRMVDRVYLPGQKNPIALRPNTPELFLLARARDEAHRFANVQRERLGKKRRFHSRLDDIPGIGPKTRRVLLDAFGTIEQVAAASLEDLASVRGVSRAQAAAILLALRPPTSDLGLAELAQASEPPSDAEGEGPELTSEPVLEPEGDGNMVGDDVN
jgi:excinuclease ABC subunit C